MHFIWFTREPDLIVELSLEGDQKTETYIFLVATVPLRLASPVWDCMLKPKNGFKPLPDTIINGMPMRVLKLYDDDISALGWIFNIIHFQTDQVPRELSYDNLLAVTVLCDKYNLQNAVMPWAEGWVKCLLPVGDTTRNYQDANYQFKEGIEDWLFIGNTFFKVDGFVQFCPKILSVLVEEIVGEMDNMDTAIREPKGTDGDTIKVSFDLIPDALFRNIKSSRKRIFDDALPKLKLVLDAIHQFREAIGIVSSDTSTKACQNAIGCYEVSLVSSIGSSPEGSYYDIEALYCESCIRREVPVWRLEERVDKLQSIERYYFHRHGRETVAEKKPKHSDHVRLRSRLSLF